MNPDFTEMVRAARQQGIQVDAYTNGLLLDKYIPGLVESGLNVLRIDLDGATEESYLKYRQGSNYHRVKTNIRNLVTARALSATRSPQKIIMLCVVTSFNEHEIFQIQNLAQNLGVDELLFKTAIINYGTQYYRSTHEQNAIAPRNSAYRRGSRPKKFICPFLWRGAILHNGDLSICTEDFEGNLVVGNIIKENNFNKVYYGRRAGKIRKAILRQTGSICETCAVVGSDHYIAEISKTFR